SGVAFCLEVSRKRVSRPRLAWAWLVRPKEHEGNACWRLFYRPRPQAFPFGASRARPSVAQELAAQVIGFKSFELPGEPSGVDRESIGQLPSGFCVATRKSIPRLISGRSAVKPASDKTYTVWPVAKASLFGSGTVWLQPPSARCSASNSSIVFCSVL